MRQPTLEQLKKHLEIAGPEMILESAQHLPEEERLELEKLVKAAPKAKAKGIKRRAKRKP